ncbi:MAG: RAMP superfamily CRISPR-associated protein [Candidatus Diapherotrites archaeon]
MPQGESFWNPYRLVPVRLTTRDYPKRQAPNTHERFTGKNGILHCTLENLTLLFIPDHHNNSQFCHRKMEDGERLIIPGSSLKGMLRSLAELVGGGCFSTCPDERKKQKKGVPLYCLKLPQEYKPCQEARNLCVTCRIFGMMEREEQSRVHQGQVNISDAVIKEPLDTWQTQECQALLEGPKPTHTAFYTTPTTGKADGLARKMYFHQPRGRHSVLEVPPDIPQKHKDKIRTINALKPGHKFDFQVSFANLQEEELGLLVYVLALENSEQDQRTKKIGDEGPTLHGPMRHKLGLGKPLGMGSCAITVNRLSYLSPAHRRLESSQAIVPTQYEGAALTTEIRRLTREFVVDNSVTMQHLRKMMVWDESDPRDFRYPRFLWFKIKEQDAFKSHPEHGHLPLKKI